MKQRMMFKETVFVCCLLLVGGWIAGAGRWLAGQQTTASRAVLLKNGNVLLGRPTYVGEQCVIELDNGAQIRLATRAIQADCRDLLECYEQLRRSLPEGSRAAPHLELAQWCLRYGLLEQAADQALSAMRAEPDHAGIDALLRQIRVAGQHGVEKSGQTSTGSSDAGRAVVVDELDQLARSVPQPALAMFSSRVQPLLINRCGGSGCHTGHRAGAFRLLEPPRGGTFFRRLTLRNLQTTLVQVNLQFPEESPLLSVPQKAHGPTNVVVIAGESDPLYQQLRDWIDKLNGLQPPTKSFDAVSEESRRLGGGMAGEVPLEPQLKTGTPMEEPAGRGSGSVRTLGGAELSNASRASATPASPTAAAPPEGKPAVSPLAGDPFDPTLFNRKVHGRP